MGKKKILNKEQQEELEQLIKSITKEAKSVVGEYKKNRSEISGSYIHIHENSSILDDSE